MKQLTLALATIVLLCGASPADLPEPLQPYMNEDVFDPGDFEWMRGAFPETSDEQKAQYLAISNWRDECSNDEKERVRSELARRGFPDVELEDVPITTDFCHQFAVGPRSDQFENFDEFSTSLVSTRPIFDAFIAATDIATRLARMPGQDLASDLHQRTIAEQVVRNAFLWTQVPDRQPRMPLLTDRQRTIFLMLNSAEMGRLDRTNTTWLKQFVAEHGWPTYSLVGEDASRKAWLLAQHADHDPVFQLDVLRMMEPLVEAGEVDKGNYAYLYDRVMLKLIGTQRYATQVTCEDGVRVPRPVENQEQLSALRASVGLVPFDEYLKWFSTPCPAN